MDFHISDLTNRNLIDLRNLYGNNKKIPESYELPILQALSHFPELKDVKINFKITSNSIFPYASRPNWKTLFRNKRNWEYLITIDKTSKLFQELLFEQLPYNAKIGIMGHELSHTVFYLKMDILSIFKVAMFYFIPSYRKKFERETDRIAIAHQLKKELYEYSIYLRSINNFPKKYGWINKYYLSPEEILAA